jgi:hypothetical protein
MTNNPPLFEAGLAIARPLVEYFIATIKRGGEGMIHQDSLADAMRENLIIEDEDKLTAGARLLMQIFLEIMSTRVIEEDKIDSLVYIFAASIYHACLVNDVEPRVLEGANWQP